jgi:hypothetical protein
MFQGHIFRESESEGDVTDEDFAPKREQRIPPRRHLRWSRLFVLFVLLLFGLHLLVAGSGEGTGTTLFPSPQASPGFDTAKKGLGSRPSVVPSSLGMGAGASSSQRTSTASPAAVCLNPFDATCWLQNAAQWLAQQIMGALQPVTSAILNSPLNILTQTPPADTYQNATLITWFSAFLNVVDLALASLIVIGGYNVMVGRQLGWGHSELAEFLPRLLLAFGAAHFGLFFLGLFIDLENALSSVATSLAGTSMLTNTILGILQGNLLGEGLLVDVLAMVLAVLAILLGVQMAVRLALLWILLVLAGPGLACFALPQTTGYARMWLSLTASTVLVQFFQVVALALGGTLLSALGAGNLFSVGGTLATLLGSVAMLYLVLRIPGIVHRYAFRPMMDASSAVAGGATSFVTDVAPRLLALL